uniref:DOT1 domain-containing protein n=1 Tax=Aureoumbra lagunensis TaxID=44058 RepID=A0A7S3NEV1_9STRA
MQIMSQVTTVITPKGRKREKVEEDLAIVTPTTSYDDEKKVKFQKLNESNEDHWSIAMSIFTKFEPGLGHDGVGLYGTPTPASARKVLERLSVSGCTHIDIGAADGKMMLGAMALGAERSFGIELAGNCLVTKFNAMKAKLANAIGRHDLDTTLACDTDIINLSPEGVHQWIAHVFGRDPGNNIVLSAVWHGFTIDAKKSFAACHCKC